MTHNPIVEAGVNTGCSCGWRNRGGSWVFHANRAEQEESQRYIDKLKSMKPDDDWGDKFYAALQALEAVMGEGVVARPEPPHVLMARLIEDIKWQWKRVI